MFVCPQIALAIASFEYRGRDVETVVDIFGLFGVFAVVLIISFITAVIGGVVYLLILE